MYTRFIAVFMFLMSGMANATSSTANLNLMPWPQEIEVKSEERLEGDGITLNVQGNTSLRLQQSKARFQHKVASQLGAKTYNSPIEVTISVAQSVSQTIPVPQEDEAYRLTVTLQGVKLDANTELGAMHGMQTLLQLLRYDEAGKLHLPLVHIEDFPRFSWRGLMLDPARRFIPMDDIKRQIDGMESAKLNVFHWHLTDDQGWRVESKRFPKLHELASDGEYYSQDDMREIVQYAHARGIRVIPEIDVPGHGSAIAVAYPEFMSAPGPYEMERHWGVHEPTLNPINEEVYAFIDGLVEELSALFPDPYFHIGGDEVKPTQWNNNNAIQDFIAANNLVDYKGMQAHFNRRVNAILAEHDKIMVGWDEIHHPDLPKDILIQSWRGHDSINHKAKNNRQSVLSTGYYIDQPQPTGYHYRNDPIPVPEVVESLPRTGEQWQTWSFEIPRLRGSAITGSFTLFTFDGQVTRGFIDFAGRSRKKLNNIRTIIDEIRFDLDTWMGPFQARVKTVGDTLNAEAVVGNGRYNMLGNVIAASDIEGSRIPEGIELAPLSEEEQALVLGGEATLWGEIVTPENIDLRLWPRTYAIAERLWSARHMNNEDFMYQRLAFISDFAAQTVGLHHDKQRDEGLKALLGSSDITALLVLSEALEQAQYYHRHHAKSQADEYHQFAPLDRFVDALPAESIQVRQLDKWITAWLADPADKRIENKMVTLFNTWQSNAERLLPTVSGHPRLHRIQPLVKSVIDTSREAKALITAIKTNTKLSSQQVEGVADVIDAATQIREEIVVSSAFAVEKLLHRAAQASIMIANESFSQAFTKPGMFTQGIEGPAVDTQGNLYAVNYLRQGTIGVVSPLGETSLHVTLPQGSTGNGIRFGNDGTMYIADYTGHNVLRIAAESDIVKVHAHNSAMNQPNDIAITQSGILFASDPNWANESGQLWRIMPNGETQLLEAKMGTTNGVAVCSNDSRLYVNESVQRRIWVYKLSANGSISDKALFYQFDDHGLDGMRCDSKGNLYVARYGAGEVAIISPNGTLIKNIKLGGAHPTNLAFGGIDGKRVYVTMQSKKAIEYFTAPHPGATYRHH